jgi:hypothetical protein
MIKTNVCFDFTDFQDWKKRINRESQEAWAQHKEQNHSIVVDLFHGQLCRSNICDECQHRIDRFEPFPCLSVNLRVQFAHTITVVRLPPPHHHHHHNNDDDDDNGAGTGTGTGGRGVDHRVLIQYGVLTPQVGLVGDLKIALSEKCNIPR